MIVLFAHIAFDSVLKLVQPFNQSNCIRQTLDTNIKIRIVLLIILSLQTHMMDMNTDVTMGVNSPNQTDDRLTNVKFFLSFHGTLEFLVMVVLFLFPVNDAM